MKCQRCPNEVAERNDGYQPKFCSRSCANVRSFSEDSNRKRGESNKRAAGQKSPEERAEQSKRGRDAKAKRREEDLATKAFDQLSGSLKSERILLEQGGLCLLCSIPQEWNKLPLKFHLDHIDGDRTDNSRSNLRLICPNCHSQTETYCGRNHRNVLDEELKAHLADSSSTLDTLQSLGLQPSGKNYQRVKRVLADVG